MKKSTKKSMKLVLGWALFSLVSYGTAKAEEPRPYCEKVIGHVTYNALIYRKCVDPTDKSFGLSQEQLNAAEDCKKVIGSDRTNAVMEEVMTDVRNFVVASGTEQKFCAVGIRLMSTE